jgi:hypothetical protein
MSGDDFICANCGNRDEVDKHGRCTACQSEQVFPDRFPTFAHEQRPAIFNRGRKANA